MTQLTPEQEAQIPYYAKKWRDIAYSTDRIDRERVTEIISRAYSLIDKEPPPIVFCSSPFDYIQKVSVFSKNRQPPSYSRLADKLGEIHQELGEFYRQIADLEKDSEDLNPKLQMSVDEALKLSFPEIFNLDELEHNLEEWEEDIKSNLQKFRQELKEEFPEFVLPEELGGRLNTQLDGGNDWFSTIPQQITHELGRHIRSLLGNGRDFSPLRLYNLIDSATDSFKRNITPGLIYNCTSNISSSANYNWFDFSISVLGCNCDREKWQVSLDILQNCGYVYPFENICYVCDRPTKILFDEHELVHALGESAIEYPDGSKIFAYHGTLFTEKYTSVPQLQWQAQWYKEESESRLRQALIEVLPSEQFQVDWLMEEKNALLRQLLIEKIGYERILNELGIDDDLNLIPQALQDISGSSLWVACTILQNRAEPKIQQVIEKWQVSGGTFEQLRKMLLIDSLERIMTWHKNNVPNYKDDFLPGLTYEEIEEKVKNLPFQLPKEVYEIYQWHNGDPNESGKFLYYYYSTLERALENSEYVNNPEGVDFRIEYQLPPYLFPIFEFEGEYFAVEGNVNESEVSILFRIGSEGDESLAFNSLTTMMMAIAESYEKGVYSYDPAANRVYWEDIEKSGKIRLKYNFGTTSEIYQGGG